MIHSVITAQLGVWQVRMAMLACTVGCMPQPIAVFHDRCLMGYVRVWGSARCSIQHQICADSDRFHPVFEMQAVPCAQVRCQDPFNQQRAKAFIAGPRGSGVRRHTGPPVCASIDFASTGMLLAAAAEDAVKPGSVDAPIGIVIGAALLVTVVLTFAIPAALNPGATQCTLLC